MFETVLLNFTNELKAYISKCEGFRTGVFIDSLFLCFPTVSSFCTRKIIIRKE